MQKPRLFVYFELQLFFKLTILINSKLLEHWNQLKYHYLLDLVLNYLVKSYTNSLITKVENSQKFLLPMN